MSRTLDPKLETQLIEMASTEPRQAMSFIVTLKKGVRPRDVLPFTIDNEFEIISAASGRMTAAEALSLSKRDVVERIELDGEMHALRGGAAKAR